MLKVRRTRRLSEVEEAPMRHVPITLMMLGCLAVTSCSSDGGSDVGDPTTSSTAASTSLVDESPSSSDDTVVAAPSDLEDALRAAATQHWDDYQALDAIGLFEMQTDRCRLVNTLEDFEASFEFVDEEQLADLVITLGDVTVEGDRGEVVVVVTRGDGEQVDTGSPDGVQPWLLVDGEWRQDDC
jgi:hypothetical protein